MAATKSGRGVRRRPRDKAKALDPNPFLGLLREVKPDVDSRLDVLLNQHVQQHQDSGREVVEMLTQARELTGRGGKRLRAALVVVGQKAFERSRPARWETALACGVAVELLQSYFLIHDDWMDQDDTRRGGPSVHAALTRRFRSAHKGAASAILTGDYLVALATKQFAEATRRSKQLPELMRCFADMQLAAVVGQQLDVVGQAPNAERVYELKTSSYTVAGPLTLGALLAGASRAKLNGLEAYADPLGVAFQLRDDILGVFGDPKRTGKPSGNDIVAGKWTWLVEHALSNGRPKHKRAIKAALGNAGSSELQVEAATAALLDSGAVSACEARISELRAQSERALSRLRLPSRGNELLAGAIVALSERQS